MNIFDLTRSPFVQESTLHGVSHLRHSKSKVRIAFWLILSFLAMGYASYEIAREINRISSGVEFETTYRLAQINEIQLPETFYCYSNYFDVFDWRIVSDYMVKFNWTIEDVGHLFATYPGFDDKIDFKSKNASIRHVQQLGNITSETLEAMRKRICRHQNRTNGSPLNMVRYAQMRMMCTLIDCLQEEENERAGISFVSVPNNTPDRLTTNLRMSIVNFMWKVHGLDVDTGVQHYLVSFSSYPAVTYLRMNTVNILFVHPIMYNVPKTTRVPCYKHTCNSRGQKQPCWNHSPVIVLERGIDCFRWQYRIDNFVNGADVNLKKESLKTEDTVLLIYYPFFENWQVSEHRPLFLWYQILSNIGGTLSIWTGASFLSFLHILEVFCCMCYKRKWKVGDNSQPAQSVV